MITKEIKISRLLEEYPDSLNVLLNISPHFSKLQNKLLRKALAGRVTLEQAASIAGVDLNILLNELNKFNGTSGNSVSETNVNNNTKEETESFSKKVSFDENKIVKLDVRPILNSGKDPLKDIMQKVKQLRDDEVLLIINSFEPIPLYSVLGKKGFSHFTKKEEQTFFVYFYKNKEEDKSEYSQAVIDENDFENIIELDVSQLQPPEPMMKILETLNQVDEKTCLLIYHHREPNLLYPKLEERGYQAFCNKLGEDHYKILITKK